MERQRLEALSNESLRKLAALEGLDVPDDVVRILLIDALLEVFEEKQEEQEQQNNNLMQVSQKKYDLTVLDFENYPENSLETLLPLSYHEPKIQFLLRDPFWAYVYWDVKGGSISSIKRQSDSEKIILRIFRLKKIPKGAIVNFSDVADSFDIELGNQDYSWYINIPVQDAYYCAALVFVGKQKEITHVCSNVQYVPPVYTLDELLNSHDSKREIIYNSIEMEKLDIFYTKVQKPDRFGRSEDT